MEMIWVVSITALLVFCLWVTFKLGYRRGYERGATMVLKDWKEWLNTIEGDE